MVYRIYVEKKPGFDGEAQSLRNELVSLLGIKELSGLRLLNRYDVEGIDEALFEQCVPTVFSEPPVDNTYAELPTADGCVSFAVEYLPGQFDQRADSAAECIQLISQGERPLVRSARVYLLEGALTPEQVAEIKKYVINPVEAREASLETKETLKMEYPVPAAVAVLEGFNQLDEAGLAKFIEEKGLAMDLGDIKFCQEYFRTEQRDPTITEIKMIDTYWSDHCRHTTFGTILDDVQIDDAVVQEAFDRYMAMRTELGRENKPRCMMDLATIGAKELKKQGILKNLDESEEINACTVKIKCDVNGKDEDWLFLFKNETHNHPTEIEPFGGAATCIGGAIRDPLSGRSYVYQAMRVTGAGDPLKPVSETMPGKLPQRKLVTTAAAGYSSYGNQIGLATGQVDEIYHPGYVAKRMEIGAVVGATPASHVRRECPAPGDVIVLLGGRTGRDGIGGATGSSKAHKLDSLEHCGAEVQKGNAPIERKLQRLFRREDACKMIKRCNDFGAGGVSVAIGELADGLYIDLNKVTKKYEGLDGTELAISESQERMAVVVAPEDAAKFIAAAEAENLEAYQVAYKIGMVPHTIADGMGSASGILLGEHLGRGETEKARSIIRGLFPLAIGLSIAVSAVMILIARPVVSIFALPDSSVNLAVLMVRLFNIRIATRMFNAVLLSAIRAGGDTRFLLLMDSGLVWLVGIPAAYIGLLVLRVNSLPVLFLLVQTEQVVRLIVGLLRCRSGKWLHNLTEETGTQ